MILAAISYSFLQHYWWAIISLLAALLVFLLFVQGGQTFIYSIGKTAADRNMLVNALGRKWEFTFTTLVTFGGTFFASFPLFYSTSFGGAYWVWIAILFSFIIQSVAYEYRSKPNNFLGRKTFDVFLFINGALGTTLLGVAVSTFFTGSQFEVAHSNITNLMDGNVIISQWKNPAHGLEALLNIQNLCLGFTIFFLARVLGLLYFMNSIKSDEIYARTKKQLLYNAIPFVVLFITYIVMILLQDGFAVNPETKEVYMHPYKYLHNFLDMPVILIMFLIGVLLVLWGIISSLIKESETKGIWFAGVGTLFVVFALLINVGYNNTSYYPSTFDLQSSLTIENSCSSPFTLKVMGVVSLFIPAIAAYIWWAWKTMNRKKITLEELEGEDHKY